MWTARRAVPTKLARILWTTALVAACSAPAPAVPAGPTPAPPPAFDLAAVKANFTDECKDPIVVTDEFCEQVVIGGMTGTGGILNVPTRLDPSERDQAKLLCNLFVFARFDVDGKPLGYEFVGILDSSGGNLYACGV